jgi:hypothetical protein
MEPRPGIEPGTYSFLSAMEIQGCRSTTELPGLWPRKVALLK